MPVQERPTALAKPLVEVTVQVLLALLPWVTVRLEGLQATLKSGLVGAVGVALTHVLARPKHAEDEPAATTLSEYGRPLATFVSVKLVPVTSAMSALPKLQPA